jgi:hypothetical protein
MSQKGKDEWAEAKRRCRMSDEAVLMARELGMSPRTLIKNTPSPRQRWKAPVEEWVRTLYEGRFGKRIPAPAKSEARAIEQPVEPDPPPDAQNELELARAELFQKFKAGEIEEEGFFQMDSALENEIPVSGGEVNAENRVLLKRYETFRQCAELFAQEARKLDFVQRIVLFGSVARRSKRRCHDFVDFVERALPSGTNVRTSTWRSGSAT